MKRIFTFLLALMMALMMALVLAVPAFAADETYTITITNDATGHTYEAYQIFAGDLYDGILSSINWGNGVDQIKEVNGKTLAQVFNNKTAAEVAETIKTEADAKDFAQKIAPYLTNPTISAAQADDKYVISNLTAGYYLVKDKDNTLTNADDFYTAYIMKVVGDVTAAPKGDKPTLNKQIKHNESGAWGVVGDNQIGDNVEFRIITTVPHTTGYTTYDYIIHDTMSAGLVQTVDDVTIKVNDDAVLDQTYYTVTVNGDNSNSFTVTVDILNAIKDGKMEHKNELYTYYTGVLNKDALIYNDGKQENVAYLEYSNNPNVESETGKTPEKKVYDWTFKMGVNKVDEHGNPLGGAKFVLSKNGNLTVDNMNCDDNGVPAVTTDLIGLVKDGDGVYRVAMTGESNVVYVIEAGAVTIKGLDDAAYYLYETKAPAGYNQLQKPVKFEINASYKDESADIKSVSVSVGETSSSNLIAKVVNNSGSTLPSTGGIGTTIFYAVGSVLVIGAAVVLITRKRMGKSDK